jgi:large subunit ribosomal protein L9
MKVILKEEVKGLGKIGETVEVSPGYGRNYLLPRKMAMEATPHNLKIVEHERKAHEAVLRKDIEEAQALANRLSEVTLTISRQVGEGEKMFGSVTSKDVAEALERDGLPLDKRQIHLEEPLKELGFFEVPVKLHAQVTAQVKLWVVKG